MVNVISVVIWDALKQVMSRMLLWQQCKKSHALVDVGARGWCERLILSVDGESIILKIARLKPKSVEQDNTVATYIENISEMIVAMLKTSFIPMTPTAWGKSKHNAKGTGAERHGE